MLSVGYEAAPVRVRNYKAGEDPEDPDSGVEAHGKADVERLAIILPHSSELQRQKRDKLGRGRTISEETHHGSRPPPLARL